MNQLPDPADDGASLDDLRSEIDSIDTALHDLLMRRAGIVTRIGRMKQADAGVAENGFFRPSREAVVLRRLIDRHRGPFPKAAMVRLWRELMGAMLCLQGPFAVAVLSAPRLPGLWTLAHDHFGSQATINAMDSTGAVLRAVIDGQAAVGVLPLPRADDSKPWWPQLLQRDAKMPRVVARLPVGQPQVVKGFSAEALVVGRAAVQSTGSDRSLIALEIGTKVSRGGLAGLFKSTDFDLTQAFAAPDPRMAGAWLHLVEVAGFVAGDDPRLTGLDKVQGEAVRHVWPLGAYAVPFTAAELGAS